MGDQMCCIYRVLSDQFCRCASCAVPKASGLKPCRGLGYSFVNIEVVPGVGDWFLISCGMNASLFGNHNYFL